MLQQQTVSYQSQLDRRRDMLDSTEMTLRAQIAQLEGQLARTRENYSSQVKETNQNDSGSKTFLQFCDDKLTFLWSHWYSLFWTSVDSAHGF